jgi:hypothetical protein
MVFASSRVKSLEKEGSTLCLLTAVGQPVGEYAG